MILKRCKKGHYYDGDKYQSCPHCQEEGQGTRARHILRKKTSQDHAVSMHQQQDDPVTVSLLSMRRNDVSKSQLSEHKDPGTLLLASEQEDPVTVSLPYQQRGSAVESASEQEDPVTVSLPYQQGGSAAVFALEQEDPVTVSLASLQNQHAANLMTEQEDPLTVSLSSMQEEPVINPVTYHTGQNKGQDAVWRESPLTVGWFVCIKGKNFGASFAVRNGRNYIVCTADMDLAIWSSEYIKDNDVKDKYASVYFVSKYKKYVVEPNETGDLCFLNEKIIQNPVELKKYDVLSIGNTRLMFVPLCGEGFSWDKM